ncbi:MAG: hypothetical protein ABJA80_05465 [bacterium]
MKRILIGAGIASSLLLGACSASDLSTPTTLALSAGDTLAAVSVSSADASAEDVDIMMAAEASMDGTTLGGTSSYDILSAGAPSFSSSAAGSDSARFAFWGFSGNCTFSAATGRFTCPDVVKNGLTLSRSAAFTDANGGVMSRYNDTTTASANFQLGVSGVRTTTNGADTLSRQRTMTVTGLLGHETTRTWNGSGTRTDAGYSSDSARVRAYHAQDATTIVNVVVKLPRSANPWPQSGTITRQVAGSGSVIANGTTRTFTVSRIVTITFNGTRYVPMMIGNTAFTLDLFTGKAAKA